jgi:hypothetical protein
MGRLLILTRRDEVDAHMAERWATPLFAEQSSNGGKELRILDGPSRQEVEAQLAGVRTVAYFGHGVRNALGAPPLLDLANIGQANGVIVAVACRSAAGLGPAALAAGAQGYVGFRDELPVIDSPVIDSLICDGFSRLLGEEESVRGFERRFLAACEKIQAEYFSYRRDDNAFLIAQTAQILKLTLWALEA